MKTKHFLYLAMLFMLLSFISISITGIVKDKKGVNRAQKIFLKKEALVNESFFLLKQFGHGSDVNQSKERKNRGISTFIFEKDSLIFWSDNSIPISSIYFDTLKNNTQLSVLYNTYYCVVEQMDSNLFVGMFRLASNFPYENKFLKNGIDADFHIAEGVKIVSSGGKEKYPIVNSKGIVVFYLDYENVSAKSHIGFRLLATIFFFLVIFCFFNYLRLILKDANKEKSRFFLVFFGLFIGRVLLLLSGVLNNKLLWFDPYIYATKFAPTFGDLILNTLLFVFFTYMVNRFLYLPKRFIKYSSNLNAWTGILNVFFLLVLIYANYSSVSLITNSSLEIVVHNISQLKFMVVIAYVILLLNFLGVVLISLWVFKILKKVKLYKLYINCGALLASLLLASIIFKHSIDLSTILFAFIIYILSGYFETKVKQRSIFTSLIVYLLLFSIYVMLFTVKLSGEKNLLQNKSFAISLSTEHDPIAEYLFKSMSVKLEQDSIVLSTLRPDSFDDIKLYNYLAKNYFNAYLKKYDAQITVCRPQDSVYVSGNSMFWYPCYDFFSELIVQNGLKIPNSDFYYIDKYTGLINYLGRIKYTLNRNTEISLFIEFDSKLTTKPLGYPELLLDEGLQNQNKQLNFSYAKYHKDNLISHSGKYDYSLISHVFQDSTNSTFRLVKRNNFEHLVYQANDDNIVVISEPEIRFIDYLVLFSYVFVFYYLLALALIFLFVSRFRQINIRDSLKNKIQFSVISILIASLLLIAGSTTWFNIRKYNQTQFRIIEEKINSVYVELEHKLSFEESLHPDWQTSSYDNLGQLLIKFSDVFYSDINLYDPNGNLLATSRNEVFQLGLQSKRMNPLAFEKMSKEKLARFVHREKINKLDYLSAYVPFFNNQGELLAYLNLPYFTKQKELQEDITTLTVAIINIYVLLILLTIIIAVVISDQITKPLEILEDRFRGLILGGKYEPIIYSKNDEVGRLVKEYNKMVIELDKSVQLLAKSERELAWREMAKQVAHEIKNPLTPMRLSVQQLKRSWDDKKEDFESYLNRVTETLIEQIDNLSSIASEFSNFAIMPVANIRKVDVIEILNAVVALFNANKKVEVKFHTIEQNAFVMADSDQLNRVFINILKNGIQAIPDNRKGEVNINLELEEDRIKIEIKDNGKGIPDDIKHKLFMPNFTTKSGGMGLGLAIVKNILESVDGTINFSTEINKGTLFTVLLPVLK